MVRIYAIGIYGNELPGIEIFRNNEPIAITDPEGGDNYQPWAEVDVLYPDTLVLADPTPGTIYSPTVLQIEAQYGDQPTEYRVKMTLGKAINVPNP